MKLKKAITKQDSLVMEEDQGKVFIKRKIQELISKSNISFEKNSDGIDLKIRFNKKEN